MTGPDTAAPDTDRGGFLLAAAALREQRAEAFGADSPDIYVAQYRGVVRVHIRAEATRGHALAEVALWRDIAGMLHHELCVGVDPCACVRGILLGRAVTAAREYLGRADG